MKDIRKSWKKQMVSVAMSLILMVIPVIAVQLTGITARAGEAVLEDRYKMNLLDEVPFDFYGGSSRYGMRAYFSEGGPVFGLEPGKLLYDKSSGYQAAFSLEEKLPLDMTREQAELLYYALTAAGATEEYGEDISPGSYAMAQAAVWAVMSGQWTGVEDFRSQMEELKTHLVREEWRSAFSRCLSEYCSQIETMCSVDAVPIFASGYEKEAPIHKMTAGEDGIYRVTLETNGEWQQDSLCYDMPEGWGYVREGRNITFYCSGGKPDSRVVTGHFPDGAALGKEWHRPAEISVIEPSGEDWSLKQTVLCPVKVTKSWNVYLRFAGEDEDPNGAYRLEYHQYRHKETLKADYLIEVEKFCSETGKPLEGTGFQVMKGFDPEQLSGTNLDASQFQDTEELSACGYPIYTGNDGKALYHDSKTYEYDKTYCKGHPKPQVMKLKAGEKAAEKEKKAIENWNQKAEEDAAKAWQECVDWCEKNCSFHDIDGAEAMKKLVDDRQETYAAFVSLKQKYTVREVAVRPGYILHGLHREDKPVTVKEVLPIQRAAEENGRTVIAEQDVPMAGKATSSDAQLSSQKATSGDAIIPAESKLDDNRERIPWIWGGILETSRVRPMDQNARINSSVRENFKIEGHRTEGEFHIKKKDLDIYNSMRPMSMDGIERRMSQGDATLEGAVYGLYADEDIVHPDGKTGIVFARGDLVSIAATDKEGTASFLCVTEESQSSKRAGNLLDENLSRNGNQWIGAPLLLGKYYVKEIARSEGYELSQEGMDLPESNREAGEFISAKKGTVTIEPLPRNINGCDGSWNEFKISFYNTDEVKVTVSGYPLDADFAVVESEDLVSDRMLVGSLKCQERLDQNGQTVFIRAEGGEYRLDENGKIIYLTGQDGTPVFTDVPEKEAFVAAVYVNPSLAENKNIVASGSNSQDEKRQMKRKAKRRDKSGQSAAERAATLLAAAGYKKCTEEYPWVLLPLSGGTEEEMAGEIVEWCMKNGIWDSFLVEEIVELDGAKFGAVRYGYSVLDTERAVFHPETGQLIVRKEWEDGFYYIVYGEEDYVRNGMYFVVDKKAVGEKLNKWEPIEPEPVYTRMADTYKKGEILCDWQGRPVSELEAVGEYESVPVINRKDTLIPIEHNSYNPHENQHELVWDTSEIDWEKQEGPMEMTVRVLLPSKIMTIDGEMMTATDYYGRFSNIGYTVEAGETEIKSSSYVEKAFLRYPGAGQIYEDGFRVGVGTREIPRTVLQRVIKQPIRIEKRIDEDSYGLNNTYKIHRDPFTEQMGGYGDQEPALSAEGFRFQCYLKSDLAGTGLLETGKDGLPDYERFFEEHEDLALLLAVDWEKPDDDTDGDLKILRADELDFDGDKEFCFYGVSNMLPYGTYVIRELPPTEFPNISYQTDSPKEIIIPSVPLTDRDGTVHEDRFAEYLYDANMGAEEMEKRYHIRFREEGQVVLAHNNDGDFPVYKYGAGEEVLTQPYPNHEVAKYYHFGGAEKKGIVDSVYYDTYIGKNGEKEYQVTKTNVPVMAGVTTATDRMYAPALVPWSILDPENDTSYSKTRETGFNFLSYAEETMENSLYSARLRIQKKDKETGALICHDETIFQLFAASRDVSTDEDGWLTGSGQVLFDEAGFPVYDEREPVVLTDKNGQATDRIRFLSTGKNGYYETCQPLGAGVYVLKEVKAPGGYVRLKPVAIEIYAGQIFYYKNGDQSSRTAAKRYQKGDGTSADIWEIDVENESTEISVHKLEKGAENKYVSGAWMSLYQGAKVKKTGEHQYEGVEVIRGRNGEIKDILLSLPGKYGEAGRKLSLWRYDTGSDQVKLDEDTGILYGLNKRGVPVCFVDRETGMAFVHDQGKDCIVCPLKDGERVLANVWDGAEENKTSWKTGEEGQFFAKIPWGYYVLEENEAPNQDGYVQAFLKGIKVEEMTEHQKFVMEDGFTSCKISLIDSTTKEAVTGTEMALYLAEKVPDSSRKGYHMEKKLNEEGKPYSYAVWTSSSQPFRLDHVPVGNYLLEETKVSYEQGYTTSESLEVAISEMEEMQEFVMEAEHTLLEIQKIDKLTGKSMPEHNPAELALYHAKIDENGRPVWKEDGKPVYEEDNLILQWKTEGVSGKIVDNGLDHHILFPAKIPVPGTLKGAYYRTEEGHIRFEYLPVGYYVLVETGVPDGFAMAEPMLIQLGDEGNLKKIHLARMTDAPLCVSISKHGAGEEATGELTGALMAVYERKTDGSRGKQVESWKTGMDGRYTEEENQKGQIPSGKHVGDLKPHILAYLKKGDYILSEECAPFGWARAEDITFSVEESAGNYEQLPHIIMTDPAVKGEVEIYKTDGLTGKGLSGTEFTVRNLQTGEKIFLVTGKDGHVKSGYLPAGTTGENGIFSPYTYEIQEQKAPDGYALSSAVHEFEFSYVDDLHPFLTHYYHASNQENQVKVRKMLQSGDEYLPGALLQIVEKDTGKVVDEWISGRQSHYTNGILAGIYLIKEIKTPGKGYRKAEPLEFKVTGQLEKVLILTMYDGHTTLSVEKRAADTGKFLPGALLELKHEGGEVADTWISGDGPKTFYGLEPGTYLLSEKKAPAGYEISDAVSITLEDSTLKQSAVMTDRKTRTPSGGGGEGKKNTPAQEGKVEMVKKTGYITAAYQPDEIKHRSWLEKMGTKLEKVEAGLKKWAGLPATGEAGRIAEIISIAGILLGVIVAAILRKKRGARFFVLAAVIGISISLLLGVSIAFAAWEELPGESVELQNDGKTLIREYWETEASAPEEWFETEDGARYRLMEWEQVPEAVIDREKEVYRQITYKGMEKKSTLPDHAVVEVMDEESGSHFTKEMPLLTSEYQNEVWSNDFQFRLVFHEYGSDNYRLGAAEIRLQEDELDWKPYEEELLSMIGASSEDYQISELKWEGEPYVDDQEETCRDAVALGRKKVKDCIATYGGTVKLPDIEGYRFKTVYESWEEEKTTREAVKEKSVETLPTQTEEDVDSEKSMDLWGVIKRYAVLTIELAAVLLAVAGVRLFWIYLKIRSEKRKKKDKN